MAAKQNEAVSSIRRKKNTVATSDGSPFLYVSSVDKDATAEPSFYGQDEGTSAKKKMKKAGARPEARTKFRGAHRRLSGRYAAQIQVSNGESRTWLGTFATAEDAARAYDAAAVKLLGAMAVTNFEQPRTSAAAADVGDESPMDLGDFPPELLALNLFSDSIVPGAQIDEPMIGDPLRPTQEYLGSFDTAEDAAVDKLPLVRKALEKDTMGNPYALTEFHGVSTQTDGKAKTWPDTFAAAEDATGAYDAAAVKLHGAAAKTKFEVGDGIDVQAVGLEKAARSGFRGVSETQNGKYRARISVKGAQLYLGLFDKAEDATSAYDAEAVRLHGDRAITNFNRPAMDLNGDLPQAELQWVDELLQDMDFTDVAAKTGVENALF